MVVEVVVVEVVVASISTATSKLEVAPRQVNRRRMRIIFGILLLVFACDWCGQSLVSLCSCAVESLSNESGHVG